MRCKSTTAQGSRCKNEAVSGGNTCRVHFNKSKNKLRRNVEIFCNFCGKTKQEVRKLVAGPSVFICDECVDLCVEIIWDDELLKTDNTYFKYLREKIVGHKNPKSPIEELGFKPRFNTLKFEKKENHCFFLCPFSEPFNSIYIDHVRPILERHGMTVDRADEIFGTQPIIEDIWEAINSAEVIIADVTGKNPNVMYEIGMAHTIGKSVIIMTQSVDDVPFDLKHYRCIVYSFTPRGVEALESQILGTVKFIKGAGIVKA